MLDSHPAISPVHHQLFFKEGKSSKSLKKIKRIMKSIQYKKEGNVTIGEIENS
jgi:hypothetical protein